MTLVIVIHRLICRGFEGAPFLTGYIRASVDALCRDGAGLISRERVKRGRFTRQGTTS